jgi:hypothetical protein
MIDPGEARRLLDVADDGPERDRAVEELLARVTPEEMGAAWARYAERAAALAEHPDTEDDEDGWAVDLYSEHLFWKREDVVLRFHAAAIANAASVGALAWAGANLDGLLSDDPDRVAWFEAQAERSERFRQALSYARVSENVSPATLERIEAAAGIKLW